MRNALAQHLRPYLHSPAEATQANPGWSGMSTFEKSVVVGIPLVIVAALGIHRVRTGRWWTSDKSTPAREWVLSAEQDNYGDWYWIARSGVEQIDSEDVPTDQHAWPTKEVALVAGYDYITKILKEKVL